MPLYDYLCKKCDRSFELLVNATAKPACPHCGSKRLDKQLSAPVRPGRSRALMAAGRRQAAREGHTCNYRHSNGKVVD